MKRRSIASLLLRVLVCSSAALVLCIILFVVAYIAYKGIPNLKPSLFAWSYNSTNVSLMPALLNTLLMTLLALALAVPVGIGAAIYMSEYAKRGSRLIAVIRMTAETLSGVPSIIYGLFGYLFFVLALKWGTSLISGACTLAIMILPLVMRTAEEAMLCVSDSYREGSLALGAGKLRTVMRVVLPSSVSGILSGVVLSIGRMVGESAALIYTAGTVAKLAGSLFDSSRTLSVHMYILSSEGLHVDETYATALVLLLLVVGMNALSSKIAKRFTKG